MKKIILRVFICLLLFFLIHVCVLFIVGFSDNYTKADIALVFGNEVYEDGSISPRLKDRLDKAIELYNKGIIKLLVVSGGIDTFKNDEASVMKQYLIETGNIPESKITTDNTGKNTNASALFIKKFMNDNNYNSVICVSQYSHLLRAELSLHLNGVSNVSHAHANYRWQNADILTLFREFVGFYVYLVKGIVK